MLTPWEPKHCFLLKSSLFYACQGRTSHLDLAGRRQPRLRDSPRFLLKDSLHNVGPLERSGPEHALNERCGLSSSYRARWYPVGGSMARCPHWRNRTMSIPPWFGEMVIPGDQSPVDVRRHKFHRRIGSHEVKPVIFVRVIGQNCCEYSAKEGRNHRLQLQWRLQLSRCGSCSVPRAVLNPPQIDIF